MKSVSMALWATAALVMSGAAAADGPDWSYVQAGYLRADNFNDDDTDGFRVEGSLGFAGMWHAQAEYIDGTEGSPGGDSDFDGFRLVIGAHPSVTDNTDAVFEIQYFDLTFDDDCGPGCDTDDDGFGVGAGLRHIIADKVEVNGMASWNEGTSDPDNASDADFTDISLEFGGRWLFTDNFSAGVTVVTNDPITSGDSATIDLRYAFAGM